MQKIALAKPDLAPYGSASEQTLKKHRKWQPLLNRLVYGNNVAQVEQFIRTGAVDAGFVSLAQVKQANADMAHVWIVPNDDYSPLEQKVIYLKQKATSNWGQDFLDFVLSVEGQAIVNRMGYGVVNEQGTES